MHDKSGQNSPFHPHLRTQTVCFPVSATWVKTGQNIPVYVQFHSSLKATSSTLNLKKKEHINTNSFISAQREFLFLYFLSFLLHRWEEQHFFFPFFMNASTQESDNKAVHADTVWMCVDAAGLKKPQCLNPLYLPRLLSREGAALWNIHEALARHHVWTSLPDQRLSRVCFFFSPECTLTYVWFSRADLLGDLGERWIRLEGQSKKTTSWWALHQQIYQTGTHLVFSDAFAPNV